MKDNYVWDTKKAKVNIKKHGITFEESVEVFDDPYAIESLDEKSSLLDEFRYRIIGRVKRQVVVLVAYTQRDGISRIISARYATPKERQAYYDNF